MPPEKPRDKMGRIIRETIQREPNGHIVYNTVFKQGAPWQSNSGEKKALVIMVEFPDTTHRVTKGLFESVWTSQTMPGLDKYYNVVSNSTLSVSYGSHGVGDWIMMPKSYEQYIIDGHYSYFTIVNDIAQDAYEKVLSTGIDIKEYDKDSNGLPDITVYFLAGNSGSVGGDMLGDFTMTTEKQTIVMVAEDYAAGEYTSPTLIHEMAHAMVPIWDLYDYSYTSSPIQNWDIMSNSWDGFCGMCSFTRWKAEWIDLKWLDKPGDYVIDDLNGSGENKAYGIKIPGSDQEWLLLEFRQKTGLDAFFHGLPDEGLVVYIVDDKRPYGGRFNTLTRNYRTHGIKFLKCIKPNETITPESTPGTSPYVKIERTTPNLAISNVSKDGNSMKFTLTYERPKLPVASAPDKVYCGKIPKRTKIDVELPFMNIGTGTLYIVLQSKSKYITLDRTSFIGNDEKITATIDAKDLKMGKYSENLFFLNKSSEIAGSIFFEFEVAPMQGDLDKNDIVDEKDLVLFKKVYGLTGESPIFNPDADFNSDGVIDINDLFLLARNFSSTPK